jgi:predicted nucleic acid-binding protein
MRFVLDNSVTMRWLFNDGSASDQSYAKQVLNAVAQGEVWVPGVWCLEVVNVIARAESKHGLTHARSAQFIHLLEEMCIQIDSKTADFAMSDTLSLARQYSLSAYDASYLELALRQGMPIATLDNDLQKAAKKAGAKRLSSQNMHL